MNRVFSPLQQFLITWLLILITGWVTVSALSYIGELISILITAGLIAFLLNYPVVRLRPFLSRGIAAVLVYALAGISVAVLGVTVVPPVLEQARQLLANLPSLFESGRQQLIGFQDWSVGHNLPFDIPILEQQLLAQVQEQVQAIATKGVGLVVGTFNWVLDLVLILVISFYMLVDGERVWRSITSVFSVRIREQLTLSLQRNLQQFVSGQLILGLFMAITLSPIFWWLRVPFFLLFAVFIGVMEVIPFVGATLGISIVGTVVAFIDWWLALQVVGTAIAVQQVKDNVVAPRIMGNLTGLSPVFIFASLLLGGRIGGLLGVVLAIPLTGVVKSIAEIVLEPTLPPQTGSFFRNPLEADEPVDPEPSSSAQTLSEDQDSDYAESKIAQTDARTSSETELQDTEKKTSIVNR